VLAAPARGLPQREYQADAGAIRRLQWSTASIPPACMLWTGQC